VTGLLVSITFRFRRDPGIMAEDTGREAVMRWRTEALWEYARGALWVLPGISLIAALVLGALLSKVRVGAGMPVQRLLFQGTADDARTLLIGITGTVITVIALVLGLTLVALQLSSTQYSPRVLRNFLRDRPNQVFLSVIVATFAYSAAGLYTVGVSAGRRTASYPQLAVTVAVVLLFVSLGALIFFLDHLAHSIQIDRLMAVIERATMQVIVDEARGAPDRSGDGQVPEPPARAVAVHARKDGYVQTVHPELLVPLAERLQVIVRIIPLVGDYVVPGHPIAYAWRTSMAQQPPDPQDLAGAVQHAVRVGVERTLQQDVRFGLRQLVDIALRALSPAVNDPYTGIQAIHRLTVLLCALATRPLGDYMVAGRDAVAGAVVHAPSFEDFVDLACGLIRRYGASEPTVTTALLRMLQDVQDLVTDPGRHQVLTKEARLVMSDAERATLQPADLRGVRDQAASLLHGES
jgi:uncharacterized membrane protein